MEAIIPDLDKKALSMARKVLEEKSVEDELAEVLASGSGSVFWTRGLKPYLETRIERQKEMSEVDLDGSESLQEVGTRFLICSTIAQELQNIISRVEVTAQVVKEQKEKKEKK